MARYVTTADFDAVCDARAALFDDGGSFSSTHFEKAADLASAMARAVAENAGYNTGDGDSSDNDMVKALALSYLVHMAYGRRQREVPAALSAILAPLPEGVWSGDLPIPGLTPSAADAVGGIASTDRSPTSTSGRPPIFKDLSKVR